MFIPNKMFIPYLILEEYYKRKQVEDNEIRRKLCEYVGQYFKAPYIAFRKYRYEVPKIDIEYKNGQTSVIYVNGEKISFYPCRKIGRYGYEYNPREQRIFNRFIKNKKINEVVKNFGIRFERFGSNGWQSYSLNTNINNIRFQIDIKFGKTMQFLVHDVSSKENVYVDTINENQETQIQLNKNYKEEEIGQLLASLKVDISILPKKEQEEINQLYISTIGQLNEKQEVKIKEFRQKQIDRIMLAYQKFKEITELLNGTKMDLNFDRINIDDLKSIIFKNNGHPNRNGYIEFEDFFKNNMILRMLDLSQLDLDNVDIRSMDFSGTNIHINPQTIYNKDMTGVNATGVHFSPFEDCFDDVILDGTIINDYEAMIDFNKLKSYNDNTVIEKEVVSRFSTR